jgi:hypothetical protein
VDEITLRLPRDKSFRGVVHLVLGGLASRLNLTWDHLQDLQLALDTLLERGEGEATLRIRIEPAAIEAAVGPFDGALRAELERAPHGSMGLRRILDTVVDAVAVSEEGGEEWVVLRKRLPVSEGAGR